MRVSQSEERPYFTQKHPGDIDGQVLKSGYIVSLACGPLRKPRYINMNIENELTEFKVEIKEKFEKSKLNKTYVFPRVLSHRSNSDDQDGSFP